MCDLELTLTMPFPKPFALKISVWKLCNPGIQLDFHGSVGGLMTSCGPMTTGPDTAWEVLKTNFLETTKNFHKNNWWWYDCISKVVEEKKHCMGRTLQLLFESGVCLRSKWFVHFPSSYWSCLSCDC